MWGRVMMSSMSWSRDQEVVGSAAWLYSRQTHRYSQIGFKLTIFQSQSPKCWDYKYHTHIHCILLLSMPEARQGTTGLQVILGPFLCHILKSSQKAVLYGMMIADVSKVLNRELRRK